MSVHTAVTNHLVTEIASIPQGTGFRLPFNPLPSNFVCEGFYFISLFNFSRFKHFHQWWITFEVSHFTSDNFPTGYT